LVVGDEGKNRGIEEALEGSGGDGGENKMSLELRKVGGAGTLDRLSASS